MAFRFQQPPRAPYGAALAPAIPTHSLLAQVLGITALGLCITALAAYVAQGVSPAIGLVAMVVGFILLFSIYGTRSNAALSLTLFYVFTFCEGVGIAPVVGQYVRSVGPSVVVNAAITTGLGMFALAAIVYATGLDLRRFQGILTIALLGLVIVGIISLFVHFIHPEVYAWITLVIFTGLVLVDFARIRAGGDGLTPVLMAVSIYLDAINIFLALLQIFGGGRRSSD
jgi:FtsH-binding integral membrane protein